VLTSNIWNRLNSFKIGHFCCVPWLKWTRIHH